MAFLRIYKDWFVAKIVTLLKKKPFHLRTHIDYLVLSVKTAGFLPKNIIALELFGMYGLYLTKHYAYYCDHIDMWEIDPNYVRYAKKFREPNVTIIQGDSVSAVRNGTITKKYNFLMIDNPLISPYGDGLTEHFDVMPQIFDLADNSFIVIFNIILAEPESLYEEYHFTSEAHQKKLFTWIEKRKVFYQNPNGFTLKPQEYVKVYESKFKQWGLDVEFSAYQPRSMKVGFLAFALKKRHI